MSDQDPPAAPVPPASQPLTPAFPSYPTAGIQDERRSMPPPTTTKAMWALILAIVPVPLAWIASIILAIQTLSESKGGRQNGKGMAIAALIIVPLWIALIIAFVVVGGADDADRDASGAVTRSGDVRSTDLRQGDCVADNLAEKEYTTIQLTPCGSPHFFEAYATFTLPDGDFPGQDEVDRLSNGGCAKRFEPYIGIPFDDSALEVLFLRPLESSWSINRGVTCLVSDGVSTTDSFKGAKR